jgi:TfoX/Sxy family transcriptional regulator of competence genes
MLTVSRAPLSTLEAFRQRIGWRFKWVSSFGSDFNVPFTCPSRWKNDRRGYMAKDAKATRSNKSASEVDLSFTPVVKAFVRDRQVSYVKMFASMGLKVNGKVFAVLVKGKFVTKLPRDRVDELVRLGNGTYFDPGHGRLMKEWVAVSCGQESWVELAREAALRRES